MYNNLFLELLGGLCAPSISAEWEVQVHHKLKPSRLEIEKGDQKLKMVDHNLKLFLPFIML